MRRLLGILAVLALTANSAIAAVKYFYVADSSPPVNPSAAFNVNVYLREAVTGGDLSLLVAENGLLGAGFKVTRTGSLPSSPASISGVAGSSSFTEQSPTNAFTSTTAQVTEGVSLAAANGVATVDLGGGIRQILLGTLSMTAGAAPNETTSFAVAPITPNGSTLTFTNGYDLDATSTSPPFTGAEGTAFDIVTTPEPGITTLVLVGTVGLACRRRRR